MYCLMYQITVEWYILLMSDQLDRILHNILVARFFTPDTAWLWLLYMALLLQL